MKKIVLLLIVLSVCADVSSQMLPFHRYTSRDGLIADRITAIHQDHNGVMWFGSFFGLCSYDGIGFYKIPLPFAQQNKYVTSIASVGEKIYAGFLFGGGFIEYAKGRVHAYSIAVNGQNIPGDIIAVGKYDENSVLVATGENDIYRFSNEKFTLVYSLKKQLKEPSIRGLLTDRSRNIWVSSESGLWMIPAKANQPTRRFYSGFSVISLLQSPEGRIWMAISNAKNGSVITFEGLEGDSLKNKRELLNLPGLTLPGFQGNMQRGVWVVHQSKGLFNISPDGKVQHYPSALNLYADITALYSDRENNLWIANDPGLIKISSFSSVSWYFDEPAATGGFILQDTNGITWISNSKELYRIKNDSIKKIQFRGKETGYIGKMLFDSSHNIWMVRWDEGVWKTKWKGDHLVSRKFISRYRNEKLIAGALNLDAQGNLWVAGSNGIFHMKNDEVKEQFDLTLPQGVTAFVNVIIPDTKRKILWLGDNALGLIKVSYEVLADGHYRYRMEKIYGPAEGLKDTYIRSMLRDHKDDLWIGTRAGGVYRLSTLGDDNKVQEMFPPGGISCSRITAIVEEQDAAIWLASCDGVYRFDHKTAEWRHYSVSDGLLSAEVFHMAVDHTRQQVWAMTELGVTRIDLNSIPQKLVPPLVHIKQVNVLGKSDTLALYQHGMRQYEHAHNSIGFVFAGSSFVNEKNIRYKYMLEGYDKHWIESGSGNSVNYVSLPPAKYNFKVVAANAGGEWSEQPASYPFEIILPFYRSPWFIFSCIVLVGALFYLIRVDRLKHQYQVEKIRMRIARDLHDDIGSALGSINLMSETANRRLSKNTEATEVAAVFNKIGNSAQTTLESMDDIIWSINPDKDKLGDLVVRMREFAIPLLEARDIHFDFKVNAVDSRKLPMNLRKNVFLIFKEIIFNIIKHAECTKVDIEAEIRNGEYYMCVADNGKGFQQYEPTQRNGLKNMKKRSEMLDGQLTIKSEPTHGTQIHFHCPVK